MAKAEGRKLTVIAQDPSVFRRGKILRATVEVPGEYLRPGPEGYRVRVVDYDVTTNTWYRPVALNGEDIFASADDGRLLEDPTFHGQNVYAIIMATLSRFEYALGRRVGWSFKGHQIKVAPHAFADANAFYSERDEALCFGYFPGRKRIVFTCLSRDVVAHETTHAILDGLRTRYTDPSSPDQAAFHEAFADIVAILSVFGSGEVVDALLPRGTRPDIVPRLALEPDPLRHSALLGLAEQMGKELSAIRGGALRQSATLKPGTYLDLPQYREPHLRGEVLVAAILRAFVDVWAARVRRLGEVHRGEVARDRAVEDGANAAQHLLTIVIRAIDYAPPVDLQFSDFLSALLTADSELFPDDAKYRFRAVILRSCAEYGIRPASNAKSEGLWEPFDGTVDVGRNHFRSLQFDANEMFRFVWENRDALKIYPGAYCRVESVRPCERQSTDGFFLRETVAEYTEILRIKASELRRISVPSRDGEPATRVQRPDALSKDASVTLYGGGTLIFDEFGRLKYHVKNSVDSHRQSERLVSLVESGFFDQADGRRRIAALHMRRGAGFFAGGG